MAFRIVPAGLIVGQIGTGQIAPGAVTSSKIAAGAVNTAELAAGAVTTAQIAAAAGILGSQLANGTITGGNIAAGTITAGLLAAGIVVAGIVDGTEILGAELVADGSSGGIYEFSGTPALGNLILSAAPFTGVDPVAGNAIQKGLCSYDPSTGSVVRIDGASLSLQPSGFFQAAAIAAGNGYLTLTSPEMTNTDFSALLRLRSPGESLGAGQAVAELQAGLLLQNFGASVPAGVAGYVLAYADQFGQFHVPGAIQSDTNLEITNLGAPPGAGGSGAKFYTTSGHAQARSGQAATGGDTNSYDLEQFTVELDADTASLTNTVAAVITSGAKTLQKAVAAQKYRVTAVIPVKQGAAAGAVTVALHGPAVASGGTGGEAHDNNPSSNVSWTSTGLGTATVTQTNIGRTTIFRFDGVLTFSASGTLSVQASTSLAADPYSVQAGAFLEVQPVVAT